MKKWIVKNWSCGSLFTCLVLGLSAAWLLPVSVHGQSAFSGLGSPEGEDASSVAVQVSADGSTVVGTIRVEVEFNEETDIVPKAFCWTAGGGMKTLPLNIETEEHRGLGVSGNGSVVVGILRVYDEGDGMNILGTLERPFRWTAGDEIKTLAVPDGAFQSGATAISADGSTIVGFVDSEDGIQAFRWVRGNGATGGLGFFPGGIESRALAVSADGSVIAGYGHHADGIRAFRWTAQDGFENLGVTAGALASRATSVSSDGSVVVGVLEREDRTVRAFRWELLGGMIEITPPTNTRSWLASAVSADGGTVVGQMIGLDRSVEAYIWDSTNGMRSIRSLLEAELVELTDWRLDIATGISADGSVVVGAGVNPDGKGEAWRAVLILP